MRTKESTQDLRGTIALDRMTLVQARAVTVVSVQPQSSRMRWVALQDAKTRDVSSSLLTLASMIKRSKKVAARLKRRKIITKSSEIVAISCLIEKMLQLTTLTKWQRVSLRMTPSRKLANRCRKQTLPALSQTRSTTLSRT